METNVSVSGRRVDIAMLASGSMAECMDVVYMKSMNAQYMYVLEL